MTAPPKKNPHLLFIVQTCLTMTTTFTNKSYRKLPKNKPLQPRLPPTNSRNYKCFFTVQVCSITHDRIKIEGFFPHYINYHQIRSIKLQEPSSPSTTYSLTFNFRRAIDASFSSNWNANLIFLLSSLFPFLQLRCPFRTYYAIASATQHPLYGVTASSCLVMSSVITLTTSDADLCF